MNGMVKGAFVGSLAVVTWRELKNPQTGAPLPIPMPSAYVGTAIVFGILGFVGDSVNERIANWLAAAYFLVLLIHTAQNPPGTGSSTEEGGPVAGAEPNTNTGGTSGGNLGTLTGPGFLNPPPGLGFEP